MLAAPLSCHTKVSTYHPREYLWHCCIRRFKQEKVSLCPLCVLFLAVPLYLHAPKFLCCPSISYCTHDLSVPPNLTVPFYFWPCPPSLSMPHITDCAMPFSMPSEYRMCCLLSYCASPSLSCVPQCPLIFDHASLFLTLPLHH